MFTRNWDAAILAAVYQKETLPDKFATDMGGSAQTITATAGTRIMQIGIDASDGSQSMPPIGALQTKTSTSGGVVLGTGNTPPTYGDFKLSGDVISTFNYTAVVEKTVTDNGIQLSATYSITNTGAEAFTISEIGLIASASHNGSNATTKLLLERTVLDSPVTIEPGAVGQVTYTINVNMPSV